MAVVINSNRPQPLWQPPPTACLTAPGAAFEALSLLMHPWGGGGHDVVLLSAAAGACWRLATYPFPRTLSLRRRWCPSASHPPPPPLALPLPAWPTLTEGGRGGIRPDEGNLGIILALCAHCALLLDKLLQSHPFQMPLNLGHPDYTLAKDKCKLPSPHIRHHAKCGKPHTYPLFCSIVN